MPHIRNLLIAISALLCMALASLSLAQTRWTPLAPTNPNACSEDIANASHMTISHGGARLSGYRLEVVLNVLVTDCTETPRRAAVFFVRLSNNLTQFEARPDVVVLLADGTTVRPRIRSIDAQTVSFFDEGGELWARIRDDPRFTVEATLKDPGRYAFLFEPPEPRPPGELLGQRAIDWRETKSWFAGGERIVVRRTVRQLPHVYWRVPADRGEGFDFWYDFDNDEVPDTYVAPARGGAMRGQLFWDSNMDRRPDTAFRNPYDLPSPLDMPPDPA